MVSAKGADSHSDGTVGKALDVLDMVASHGKPVRFSDLLDRAPYPKATLYRFLQNTDASRHAVARSRFGNLCAWRAAGASGPCGMGAKLARPAGAAVA